MADHPGFDIPPAPKDTRFYVVLSGLVPLVEHETGLRAYMLDIQGHEHLAGQWLVEQRVPKRLAVTLTGVKQGGASLVDGNSAPIVNMKDRPLPSRNDQGIHAQFDLPSPRKFHFLHACPFTFSDEGNQLLNAPTQMSGTRVLEYELSGDFEDVRLIETEDNWWWANGERRTRFDGSVEVGSLHLLDGPASVQSVPEGHNQTEYRLNLDILGAGFAKVNEEEGPTPARMMLPPGLSIWETLPLAYRAASADSIQDVIRTGGVQTAKTVGGGCPCCCAPCDGKKGG